VKPAPFAYHRPTGVAEAAEMLAEFGDEAKILAGGQSLVPMLALRLAFFDHLVDIAGLDELRGITREPGWLRIGATTTGAAVGADPQVRDAVPLLTAVTPHVGHFQIRNRGTLGGSVAHADPAGEYPTVALALDARIEAVSPRGQREIDAGEFFTGLWETVLEPDEVLTAVRFPVWDGRCGFAVREFARRHGDFAIAGAVLGIELDAADRIARCAIGLLGLGSTPRRAEAAERELAGRAVTEVDPAELGELAMTGLDDVPSDLQGSAAYRRRVGAVMVARAFSDAVAQAAAKEHSHA